MVDFFQIHTIIDLPTKEPMFHFLVKSDGWHSSTDTIRSERVFEYTARIIEDQFNPKGILAENEISNIPALFTSESIGSPTPARVGYIRKIRKSGAIVKLDYMFDSDVPPIANATLQTVAGILGIEDFEFNRTHWAVKDADLFKALLIQASKSKISPKVFDLDSTEVDPDLISLMMPFDISFSGVHKTLQDLADTLDLTCLRADDIWDNESVIQDVVSLISRSRIVICDCTGRNPNVFYEAGIAHTLGKDVILITQSKDDIPFDLRHLRFVTYLNNKQGRQELAKKLKMKIAKLVT